MPSFDKILSATMKSFSNLLKTKKKRKKASESDEKSRDAWILDVPDTPDSPPEIERTRILRDDFKLCYSPGKAVAKYGKELTTFEMSEIFEHPCVYYVGHKVSKQYSYLPTFSPSHPDFRNSEGFYQAFPHDHIAYRYEILEELGKGAFGIVYKALDHKTEEFVALKVVKEGDRSRSQAEDEIRILEIIQSQDLGGSSHAIQMLDHFEFRNHICIVFELLDKSLFDILETRPPNQGGFSMETVRELATSLLECLDFLHSNDLIHCDLKPDNILFHRDHTNIRVIDFGLACVAGEDHYAYIQARSYRAPEVFLGGGYSTPIDMWSLGCILAELLTGEVLFYGEDDQDQMAAIQECLGVPPKALWADAPNAKYFFSSRGFPRYCTTIGWTASGRPVFLNGKRPSGKFRGPPKSRKLKMVLGAWVDPDFLDFLNKCLDWNPETRLSASAALKHPWILNGPSRLTTNQGLKTIVSPCLFP